MRSDRCAATGDRMTLRADYWLVAVLPAAAPAEIDGPYDNPAPA